MKATGLTAALAALVLVAGLDAAAAQQDDAAGDEGWSRMMMGPMAACPMGAREPDMAGRYMMRPGMMGGGMMGHMGARGGFDADAQLEALRDALAITPEQSEAWDAYAEAARADAETMAQMHARMMSFRSSQAATAPDWLDVHRDMMRARTESLDALSEAVATLYATLDDAQKATFDRYGGGLCGAW